MELYLQKISLLLQQFLCGKLPDTVHIICISDRNAIEINIRQRIDSLKAQPDLPAAQEPPGYVKFRLIPAVLSRTGIGFLLIVPIIGILNLMVLQQIPVHGKRRLRLQKLIVPQQLPVLCKFLSLHPSSVGLLFLCFPFRNPAMPCLSVSLS